MRQLQADEVMIESTPQLAETAAWEFSFGHALLIVWLLGVFGLCFFAGKALLEDKPQTNAADAILTIGYILLWPACLAILIVVCVLLWAWDFYHRVR